MDWTIFWTNFLDHLLNHFFWTILSGGEEAQHRHSGRGGMHYISSEVGVGGSIVTQGGVRKGLLLRGEGWEVVVIVNSSG